MPTPSPNGLEAVAAGWLSWTGDLDPNIECLIPSDGASDTRETSIFVSKNVELIHSMEIAQW